jgi:hypothetical protein
MERRKKLSWPSKSTVGKDQTTQKLVRFRIRMRERVRMRFCHNPSTDTSIGWTLRRGKKRGRKASGRGTKRRGLGGRVSVVGEKNPVGPDLVESGKLPMEGGNRWRVRKKGGKEQKRGSTHTCNM